MRKNYFLFIGLIIFINSASATELKIGILRHDVLRRGFAIHHHPLKQGHEKGYDINFEYLYNNDFKYLERFGSPTPHIGFSLNSKRKTDVLYTGLTWRKDFESQLFIEGSLGGAIHNGKLKREKKLPRKYEGLGLRVLFRESVSLGYQFSNINSISITLDHISNANISKPNHGISNIGMRFGLKL